MTKKKTKKRENHQVFVLCCTGSERHEKRNWLILYRKDTDHLNVGRWRGLRQRDLLDALDPGRGQPDPEIYKRLLGALAWRAERPVENPARILEFVIRDVKMGKAPAKMLGTWKVRRETPSERKFRCRKPERVRWLPLHEWANEMAADANWAIKAHLEDAAAQVERDAEGYNPGT